MVLNWALRYQPIVELVDRLGARTVVDVGSGPHGLSEYWNGSVIHTDLHFPVAPRDGVLAVASRAEQLPFRDDAFDVAVSVDLFEHLPLEVRPRAVTELLRVSRGPVIVAFPCGDAARRADRVLSRLIGVAGAQRPGWLVEHEAQTSYPDRDTLTAALPRGARIEADMPNENVYLHTLVMLCEMHPLTRRLTDRLDRAEPVRLLRPVAHRGRAYRSVFVLEQDRHPGATGC